MNIVLIGFRCAGKSTVGRRIAARLKRDFVDCDEYIEERTHLNIREIFDIAGESYFRGLESQAIGDLSKFEGKVIATGGGAALRYKNIQQLKRNGLIIHLQVGPESAYERFRSDAKSRPRRPPLTALDQLTEIRQQMEFRNPYYLNAADLIVRTDGRPVDDIVAEILAWLKERGIHEPPDDNELSAAE